MPAARDALVVGGGVAGMSAAIAMARTGLRVSLVERDPDWRVAGAGITITAATLRAFHAIGVLDRVIDEGHTHAGVRVCNVQGEPVGEVLSPPLGEGIPGAGGILRSTLHGILAEAVRAAGVAVRLGVTATHIEQDAGGVNVRTTDGRDARFEFVVGADGIGSRMRSLVFADATSTLFTGQACWRMTLARPAAIDRRHFFLGGAVKCGLTPVSREEMYLFVLEGVPDNPYREPSEHPRLLAQHLAGFGGVLAQIRDAIDATARIVYRPIDCYLPPDDWYRGRVILIGDAVHASSPQLASGAGMAVEDGLVLADEIAHASTVQSAFQGFMARRRERCRMVVENSLAIGRLEMSGAPPAEQTAIVARSLAALAAPI